MSITVHESRHRRNPSRPRRNGGPCFSVPSKNSPNTTGSIKGGPSPVIKYDKGSNVLVDSSSERRPVRSVPSGDVLRRLLACLGEFSTYLKARARSIVPDNHRVYPT